MNLISVFGSVSDDFDVDEKTIKKPKKIEIRLLVTASCILTDTPSWTLSNIQRLALDLNLLNKWSFEPEHSIQDGIG